MGKVVGLRKLTVNGQPVPIETFTDDIDQEAGEPLVGTDGRVYEVSAPRASQIVATVIEDEDFDMDWLLRQREGQVVGDYGTGRAVVMTGYHSRAGSKDSAAGTREVTFYGQGRRA